MVGAGPTCMHHADQLQLQIGNSLLTGFMISYSTALFRCLGTARTFWRRFSGPWSTRLT